MINRSGIVCNVKLSHGFAKSKYEKLSENNDIELWDVLQGYDLIMQQPKHMQMFIYDMICDKFIHFGEYSIVRDVDGAVYVKKIVTNSLNF